MTAELVCAATDRDAWLTARRSGVTATDIVTILGLNPWASEYALYWEKLGKLPPFEGSPRTRLGTALEPFALNLWRDEHDAHGALPISGLYRSADRPWQLATPDIWAPELDGPLELKTWDDHDRAAWEGTVPPRVRAQVLWQMDTLGVGVGHVGVLFLPSGEFESRVVEHQELGGEPEAAPGSQGAPSPDGPKYGAGTGRDAGLDPALCDLCADVAYMRQVGEAFWGRVREGLPPFPDGSPATLAAVKALHPDCSGEVEVTEGAWLDYSNARESVHFAKDILREREAALRLELGGAQVGLVEGVPVVKRTRYEVAAKTIDRKAYKVDKLARVGARNGDSDEQG